MASTVVVFATGVELWLFGLHFGSIWLAAHKLSFVVWFGATAIHGHGHIERAPRLVMADAREGDAAGGAITRRSLVGASIVLAVSTLVWQSPFVSPPGL